jgi:hypothetical protein
LGKITGSESILKNIQNEPFEKLSEYEEKSKNKFFSKKDINDS